MSIKKIPHSIEISQAETDWIDSSVDKSPDAYFRAFEMNEKQSAYRRYARLLGSNNKLSAIDRKKLMDSFEWWKINKGEQFWMDRRTHVSSMRTTGPLVESAESYAKQTFRRNALWNESSQQQDPLPSLAPGGRTIALTPSWPGWQRIISPSLQRWLHRRDVSPKLANSCRTPEVV